MISFARIRTNGITPSLAVFLSCLTFVLPFSAPTALGAADVADLVEDGMQRYHSGNFGAAADAFRQAALSAPGQPDVYLYLGTTKLQAGDLAGAIRAFERYLQLAPEGDAADAVRPNLTLIKKAWAKQQAEAAAGAEKALAPLTAEAENTIAVYAFANTGDSKYANLSRGLAAMMIHDIFQLERFKVVERVRMQALLDELALTGKGVVDPNSSAASARVLGAGKVIAGIYAAAADRLKIDSSLVDTLSEGVVDQQMAQGPMPAFWELEKMLVFSVLKDMGVDKSQILPRILAKVEKVHTKSLDAFSAYSDGLAATDLEDYAEARRQFERALQQDPHFTLAADALKALPMAAMTTAQIVSSMEAAAPATESGTLLASASSGVSTLGIGAAVVAVAAGAAVVASGGSWEGSTSGLVDVAGTWNYMQTSTSCRNTVAQGTMTFDYFNTGNGSQMIASIGGDNISEDCETYGIQCSDEISVERNPMSEGEFQEMMNQFCDIFYTHQVTQFTANQIVIYDSTYGETYTLTR